MRRSVPVSLLALVTVLALALGSVGTAAAGPDATGPDVAERTIKRTIKKVATKVVEKKAAKLSVANAANLGGLPPSAYTTDPQQNDDAGDNRNASRSAISLAAAARRWGMGYTSPRERYISTLPSFIGVSINPGATALRRMPEPTHSGSTAWRRTQRASATFEVG